MEEQKRILHAFSKALKYIPIFIISLWIIPSSWPWEIVGFMILVYFFYLVPLGVYDNTNRHIPRPIEERAKEALDNLRRLFAEAQADPTKARAYNQNDCWAKEVRRYAQQGHFKLERIGTSDQELSSLVKEIYKIAALRIWEQAKQRVAEPKYRHESEYVTNATRDIRHCVQAGGLDLVSDLGITEEDLIFVERQGKEITLYAYLADVREAADDISFSVGKVTKLADSLGQPLADFGTSEEELESCRQKGLQPTLRAAKKAIRQLRSAQSWEAAKASADKLKSLQSESGLTMDQLGISTEGLNRRLDSLRPPPEPERLWYLRYARESLSCARMECGNRSVANELGQLVYSFRSAAYDQQPLTLEEVETSISEVRSLFRQGYKAEAKKFLGEIRAIAEEKLITDELEKLSWMLKQAKASLTDIGSSPEEIEKLTQKSYAARAFDHLNTARRAAGDELFLDEFQECVEKSGRKLENFGTTQDEIAELYLSTAKSKLEHAREDYQVHQVDMDVEDLVRIITKAGRGLNFIGTSRLELWLLRYLGKINGWRFRHHPANQFFRYCQKMIESVAVITMEREKDAEEMEEDELFAPLTSGS